MTIPINLNNQPKSSTIEINNKIINRSLSQHPQGKSSEEILPEFFFSGSGVFAELFGDGDELAVVGEVEVAAIPPNPPFNKKRSNIWLPPQDRGREGDR
ncbi:hypothetical protein CYANOKiyG1_32650 [Okeania sp. KiyG1]|nr:hypothetical protein CYANOKiyG1_32650 [Okeania sp. KiyG1]